MTGLHNRPIGWIAFRVFRQNPKPRTPRQHGNRKHGQFSKQGIAGTRMVRLCIRMLRAGLGHMPVPGLVRRPAPGWSAFRRARQQSAG